MAELENAYSLSSHSKCSNFVIPHTRTLRKARIQIQLMVTDGFSTQRIKSYLKKWALWWVNTSSTWSFEKLIRWFIEK